MAFEPAISARIKQPQPDSGLGCQIKGLQAFKGVPSGGTGGSNARNGSNTEIGSDLIAARFYDKY